MRGPVMDEQLFWLAVGITLLGLAILATGVVAYQVWWTD